MLSEQTHEKLIAMKPHAMANALKTCLERVDQQNLSEEGFVSRNIDDKWLYRENRKHTAGLKFSRFKERAGDCRANGSPEV